MVEQQLRSLGLRIRAPGRPPTLSEFVREPRGRPAPARAGWEDRLVAQKPVGEPWRGRDRDTLALARKRHEDGTHNMATVVTPDGWQQLYSWPKAAQR